MRKMKVVPLRQVIVRLPQGLFDRLLRERTNRMIKEGRPVSMKGLIIEALEKSLN